MKKILKAATFIFLLFTFTNITAQNPLRQTLKNINVSNQSDYSTGGFKNIPFLTGMLKEQLDEADTIWLYHRYDINRWEDGEFYPYLSALFDYYPGTANQKYAITINMEQQDTMQKFNYYYDDKDRITATVTQNYTGNPGNVWINYDSVVKFYNGKGLDSLIMDYRWYSNDTAWKKYAYRGISYYENTKNNLIFKDSTSVWDGKKWVLTDGVKTDYLFNEFGSVYDKKYSTYQGGHWVYDFWNDYHLINDTTGEYDATNTYTWQDGEWINYFKITDIVLHNWQGFTNNVPPTEHYIKQLWDGQKWVYFKKANTFFDTLGSWEAYHYYWRDSTGWYLLVRLNTVYNEKRFRILVTNEQLVNNIWDTIYGSRYFFEYIGSIWKAMHYENYDTVLNKWIPAYDHILSDFSYILNTPEIKKKGMTNSLQLVPNPAKNSLTIELIDKTDRIKTIKVYDVNGREITNINYGSVRYKTTLDVSFLKKGIYIINVATRKGKSLKGKFIKN